MSETTDKKSGHSVNSNYLERVVVPGPRKRTVWDSMQVLTPIAEEFDAIVVTGVSGLTIGAILAHELEKNLVVIRKDTEKSHSHYAVEGDPGYNYVIVDDLYCSGETVLRILEVMKRECGQRPQCRGVLLYNQIELKFDQGRLDYFKRQFGVDRLALVADD